MSLSEQQLELTRLYLAAFDRAPEKSGLDYWASQLNAGHSLADVARTIFTLDIVKAIYPDAESNRDFLTSIYANVFGKQPDPAGLVYWEAQLGAGLDRGSLVTSIIAAGLGTPDGTEGKAFLVNRYEVAQQAVNQQIDQNQDIDPARLKDITRAVTGDATSRDAAYVALANQNAVSNSGALPAAGPDPFVQPAALSAPGAVMAPDSVPQSKFLSLWCGFSWNGNANVPEAPVGSPIVLTYSFMSGVPSYYNERFYADSPQAIHVAGFQAFSAEQQQAARQAMASLAAKTGLSFVEVGDQVGGEIRFGMQDLAAPMAGYAYLPYVEEGVPNNDPLSLDNLDQQGICGDVFLSRSYLGNASLAPGTYGYVVLLHEIGHALGLRHPVGLGAIDDNWDYTVMAGENGSNSMPVDYGAYDLAALRYLYGTDAQEQHLASEVSRSYDPVSHVYSITSDDSSHVVVGTDLVDNMLGGAGNDALYGRDGNDTVDGGSGNDTVDGGIGNDTLAGGAGNDFLQGGWGADTLDGGAGQDTLDGGWGSDVLTGRLDGDTLMGGDWAPAGVPDTVDYSRIQAPMRIELNASLESSATGLNHDGTQGHAWEIGSARLAAAASGDRLVNINRVIATDFDDFITDTKGGYDETLIGGGGNDTIESHGGGNRSYSTHDVLVGGPGDDTYIFYAAGAQILEQPGEGHDTVNWIAADKEFVMTDNVEDFSAGLLIQVQVTGNASPNMLSGSRLDDTLDGAGGNDTLNGGDGSDTLTGGSGADRFVIALSDHGTDTITDFRAEDGDRIVLDPLLDYTVTTTTSGDALLNLSNGASVRLVGIAPATVESGWLEHA